jgi:hypothetical protein
LRFISRDCKDQSAIIRIEYLVDVPGACVAFDFRTIALARSTFSLDFEMAELTRSRIVLVPVARINSPSEGESLINIRPT